MCAAPVPFLAILDRLRPPPLEPSAFRPPKASNVHSRPLPPHPSLNMKATKSVRWSTVTVYEFGVTLGGSAVPRRGGPSIGLARKPQHVWSTTLDKVRRCGDLALTNPNFSASADDQEQKESNERRKRRVQRARRVRWLKPLERITMLTKAGCSEEKIYRMMMESSDIAMSRRLCISMQRQVAA